MRPVPRGTPEAATGRGDANQSISRGFQLVM